MFFHQVDDDDVASYLDVLAYSQEYLLHAYDKCSMISVEY